MFKKNQTYNSFFKGKINRIEGVPLEAFLYMLLDQRGPCCVYLDRLYIEEVAVVLQERVGVDVCCILEKRRVVLPGFVDFYEQLSSISIQHLALDGGAISLCFVDKNIMDAPIVPKKESLFFKVGSQTSFDALVDNLSILKYKQKEGAVGPGEFFINGGLIDVVPFHANRLFRISFLEEGCLLFSVDKETNKIISKMAKSCKPF